MKRLASATLFGAVAVLLGASPARAQYVYFGGGASIPTGDFKTDAKTGWMATGGVGANVGPQGLWIEAEGYYGSNKHKAPEDGDKTTIIAGIGAVGYDLMPGKKTTPYITGGLGFLSHKFTPETGASETETNLGYTGALGVSFTASPKIHVWVEGRLLGSSASRVILAQAGLSFILGKSKM